MKSLKYVHIPKTGGNSVRKMLDGHIYVDYKASRNGVHQIHLNELPGVTSFTITRNPYDRVVSAFYYLKSPNRKETDKKDAMKWCNFDTFEEFCLNPNGLWSASKKQLHFLPQYTFIPNGVHMIGSLENLDNFIELLSDKFNIPIGESVHLNKSNRKSWLEYYTNSEVIDIVNECYKEDFLRFKYKML